MFIWIVFESTSGPDDGGSCLCFWWVMNWIHWQSFSKVLNAVIFYNSIKSVWNIHTHTQSVNVSLSLADWRTHDRSVDSLVFFKKKKTFDNKLHCTTVFYVIWKVAFLMHERRKKKKTIVSIVDCKNKFKEEVDFDICLLLLIKASSVYHDSLL